MLRIESLHHVSLPVADLGRAKAFYGGLLGLRELARPNFPFQGAWYEIGDRCLHLTVAAEPTFRLGKPVNTQDIHLALRVASYAETIAHLHVAGYTPDAADELRQTREQPDGPAGFPQVFLMDPDRHVLELNADRVD
jgi:glyoxylase I family protein